jgi:hypothetical protein
VAAIGRKVQREDQLVELQIGIGRRCVPSPKSSPTRICEHLYLLHRSEDRADERASCLWVKDDLLAVEHAIREALHQ